jgi:cell wall-associated NlpC family hydrolase
MSALIDAARAYLGTPFMHQGRSRHGLDCIGLLVCAARDAGAHIEDRTNYPRDPNGLLPIELDRQFDAVDARMPGDILLMRFAGEPQHIALYTGATLIHSYASIRRVVEHRLDIKWARRIVQTYRIKEAAWR